MKRLLSGLGIAALAISLLPALAAAKRKPRVKTPPPPTGPIEIEVVNDCKVPLAVTLGSLKTEVEGGKRSGLLSLAADAEDWIYVLHAGKTQVARLSLVPESKHEVRLADCRNGRPDVYTTWKVASEPDSPHASVMVRFRSRQSDKHLEYKLGKTGRFKPLSIAMTSYHDVASGKIEYESRLRAARKGPVVSRATKSADLAAGHRYLIEVETVGRDMFVLVEDEGIPKDDDKK